MNARELFDLLDSKFPLNLQEKYDNAGTQLLFDTGAISGILIALDCDEAVIDETERLGCNVLLSHHPLIFRPLLGMREGNPRSDRVFRLVEKKISVYAAHTNLDKVFSLRTAGLLGLKNAEVLIPTNLISGMNDKAYGFGVRGNLPEGMVLREFLQMVTRKFNIDFLVYSGRDDLFISEIAFINGSGGSMVEKILENRPPDCIITGDVGYHHAKAVLDFDKCIIDAGHFGTERILLDFLKSEIQDCLTNALMGDDIRINISGKEVNPFKIYVKGG